MIASAPALIDPIPDGCGDPAYRIDGLLVRRGAGDAAFELSVPRLRVGRGERWALVGPSGCGKSTLLDVLAMILLPTEVGRFVVNPHKGEEVDVRPLIAKRQHTALARLRACFSGYVLQTGGLMPFLTVRENIELPCRMSGQAAGGRARALAGRLGIERHLDKKPRELSVGERQRVAIARALAHRPAVVLADEPTAALDPDTSDGVMAMLVELAVEDGATVVVASHDLDRVARFGFTKVAPRTWKDRSTGCAHTEFVT